MAKSFQTLPDMTKEEKKLYLFNQQKELLNTLLEHNAISKTQYEKSLTDLKLKMGC